MFKFLRKQPAIGTIEIVPVQEGDRTLYSVKIFMAIFSFHEPRWVSVWPMSTGEYRLVYCGSDRELKLFGDHEEAFAALMSAWRTHCKLASYIEKPDLPVRK